MRRVKNDYTDLFCLQRKLDEQLLELFIAVVDAELLKRVFLEDFESIDVKHSDHKRVDARNSGMNGVVDSFHQPREQ